MRPGRHLRWYRHGDRAGHHARRARRAGHELLDAARARPLHPGRFGGVRLLPGLTCKQLSHLVDRASRGDEVAITRHGRPVARWSRPRSHARAGSSARCGERSGSPKTSTRRCRTTCRGSSTGVARDTHALIWALSNPAVGTGGEAVDRSRNGRPPERRVYLGDRDQGGARQDRRVTRPAREGRTLLWC